jgi:hypothetical protein
VPRAGEARLHPIGMTTAGASPKAGDATPPPVRLAFAARPCAPLRT